MPLRASDADRERTVAFLRAQQQAGRLTLDELEERSAAAYAAVHGDDLDALVADLPSPPAAAAPAPAPARRPRWPGRVPFSVSWRAAVSPRRAMDELLDHVVPPMHRYGYDIVEYAPHRLVFERRVTPAWVPAACVLLFPLGLLALLARTDERVAVELTERDGATMLMVHGTAPLVVRRAFAELQS